jgi:hypothetical protein
MIKVFHNPNYMEIVSGRWIPTSLPMDLVLVAEVNTNNMTEAYAFTQHWEGESWATHPRVHCVKESRSTRVGDFMQDSIGVFYVVEQKRFRIIKDVKIR